MRYAVVAMVDSEDGAEAVANEIVSTLEFERRAVVVHLVVFDEDGKDVATHSPQEEPE